MADAVRVVYLANVGTRDVLLDGQPIKSPRQDGERLWHDYDQVRERLSTPILEPGLRRAVEGAGRVDRLVLFVSDQPETTPSRYRDLDTLYLGEMLRRKLREHPELGPRLGEIVVERIAGNPADYGTTVPFYNRVLPALVPDDVVAVYVAPVGGADASNVGLWLAALRHFGSRVQMLYVMPDGRVEDLPAGRLLLADFARHRAHALLEHRDYAGLADVLEGTPEWGNTWLPHLLRALNRRLHFDFQGAAEALKAAQERARGEARARLDRLCEEMAAWLAPPRPARADDDAATWETWLDYQRRALAELYWNLCIKIERAEWVDFLGRLFRLEEGLLRLAFEQETRHSTERHADGYPDFARALEADPDLVAFLRERGIRDTDDLTRVTPNRRVLAEIVNYWVERGGKGRTLGQLRGLLGHISRLNELRNKSIIAHGFQGVEKAEIEERCGMSVRDLQHTLQRALEAVGIAVGEDPFAGLHPWIQERLEREM